MLGARFRGKLYAVNPSHSVVQGVPRYGHMANPPYPAHLVTKWTAPNGTRITVRPIRPEDALIEQEFVKLLSPAARYFRFMDGIRELTPQMLVRFTRIDYDRDMAFVAITEDGRGEKEIAVARYITNPDGTSCEFAIVVADEWQRTGLGRYMMGQLIEVARGRGLSSMSGEILAGNVGMQKLAMQLGFEVGPSPSDPSLRRATLSLR